MHFLRATLITCYTGCRVFPPQVDTIGHRLVQPTAPHFIKQFNFNLQFTATRIKDKQLWFCVHSSGAIPKSDRSDFPVYTQITPPYAKCQSRRIALRRITTNTQCPHQHRPPPQYIYILIITHEFCILRNEYASGPQADTFRFN